jgi:hypothetical protein
LSSAIPLFSHTFAVVEGLLTLLPFAVLFLLFLIDSPKQLSTSSLFTPSQVFETSHGRSRRCRRSRRRRKVEEEKEEEAQGEGG